MIPGKPLSFLSLPCFLLLFHSCQRGGSTVDQRIHQCPTLFNTKTFKEKQMITHGAIAPGMTRDAVYLAWGEPKSRNEGVENGRSFEEWTYQKLKPAANLALGIGMGGLSGPGIGLDRTVSKIVRFENGRVTGFRKFH